MLDPPPETMAPRAAGRRRSTSRSNASASAGRRHAVLRSVALHLAAPSPAAADEPEQAQPPAPPATAKDYAVGEGFLSWHAEKTVRNGSLSALWVCDDPARGADVLSYVRKSPKGDSELVLVDVTAGGKKGVRVVTAAQVVAMLAKSGAEMGGDGAAEFTLPALKMLSPTSLLLRHGDAPYALDLDAGTAALLPAPGAGKSEVPSPDGGLVLYAAGHNLHVRAATEKVGGPSRALTTDGVEHFTYGGPTGATHVSLARKAGGPQVPRPAAIWSPDSAMVLTSRVDERETEDYHLIQSAPPDGSMRPKLWSYKYALPGEPVAPTSLLIIDITTGNIVPIDVSAIFGDEHDAEGSPVAQDMAWWSEDSSTVRFIAGRRDRSSFSLCTADAKTGACTVLLTETSDSFVWLSGTSSGGRANSQFLSNGDALWWSERSGYGHLYRVSASDESVAPLTSGFFTVDAVVGLDESAADGVGKVWFTAVGREESSVGCDPYYKQIYSVLLDGTGLTLLTEAADRKWRDHSLEMASPTPSGGTSPLDTLLQPLPGADAALSPSKKFLLDEISSVEMPPTLLVRDAETGSVVRVLESADISGLVKHVAPHALPPPMPFVTVAADGKTAIRGVIQRPRHFDPERSYPIVDTCYPGPQVGRATRRFMDVYFHAPSGWAGQALAELGFVIVTLDDTGTPLRSKGFHSARYGQSDSMSGRLEDHIAAITQLAEEYPWIDADRVGITGASGGGLASTRAILQFPEFFKVAVSFCGNHDNRGYNAGWGETYHGPLEKFDDDDELEDNYETASNQYYAKNLVGKLLLIHGEMDENVHFSLSMKVANELIKENKDFDMLIVPNTDHSGVRGSYAVRRMWDYFVMHLQGVVPPKEYEISGGGESTVTH